MMATLGQGLYNLDEFRHCIERMGNLHYSKVDERRARPPSPTDERRRGARALESLLLEKGLLTSGKRSIRSSRHSKAISVAQRREGRRESVGGSRLQGAASARFDGCDCRSRLERFAGEHMVVVENTPQVHNVVVCTLCSCYSWPKDVALPLCADRFLRERGRRRAGGCLAGIRIELRLQGARTGTGRCAQPRCGSSSQCRHDRKRDSRGIG